MKIAVAGKGGSGKTIVSGTLARSFAASGYDVLAIDDDPDPNLAISLGVPRETEVPPVPDEFLDHIETAEDEPPEWELTTSAREIVDEYGVQGPAGVTLLRAGEITADEGAFGYSHVTVLNILQEIEVDSDEVLILDMAAGLGAPGMCKAVDAYVLVVEPTYDSLETIRKLNDYAEAYDVPDVRVVANRVQNDQDVDLVEEYVSDHDLSVSTIVPDDEAIRHAERSGAAPIDDDPDSAAVTAIRELAAELGASSDHRPEQRDAAD